MLPRPAILRKVRRFIFKKISRNVTDWMGWENSLLILLNVTLNDLNYPNQRPPAKLGVWGWPLEGAWATSAGDRWFLKRIFLICLRLNQRPLYLEYFRDIDWSLLSGSVCFDDYLTDSSLPYIWLLSWPIPANCKKLHKNSFLSQFISPRQWSDLHQKACPRRNGRTF